MIIPPVALTTLNRIECLKTCLTSLEGCLHAEELTVYISLDYPPSEEYWEGYSQVRDYLNQTTFLFKDTIVLAHSSNLGSIENSQWLKRYVLARHDCIVVMEDDVEVAPCFIDFCAKGLERYKNDADVVAINPSDYVMCANGFTPPIRDVSSSTGNIEKRQLIWHSYATWRNRLESILRYAEQGNYLSIGDNPRAFFKLHSKSKTFAYVYLSHTYNSDTTLPWHKGRLVAIDSMWDICMMVFDKYVICPIEPLTRDNGVFGNGERFNETFSNALELSNRPLRNNPIFNYLDFTVPINETEVELHDSVTPINGIKRMYELIKYLYRFVTRRLRHQYKPLSSPWD